MATSNNQLIQDTRFEEILELEGLEIQQFFQEAPSQQLFVDAQSHPEFFSQNLVSPNRILKHFVNDPQSNIRILYFQVLRLSYQIQAEEGSNRDFIISLRRIVFHPEFEILFTQQTEDQRDLFNDFQFKKLFAEFLVLLDKQQFPNVEQFLCHYPVMDTIFIHILRSILASQNINEQFDAKIPSEVVFGQLASLLELSITSYGNCWKFEDSDMFCYEQNQNQLFLAYIVDDGTQQFEEERSQTQSQTQQQPLTNNQNQNSTAFIQNKIHPDAVTANSNIIVPNHSYSNSAANPANAYSQKPYQPPSHHSHRQPQTYSETPKYQVSEVAKAVPIHPPTKERYQPKNYASHQPSSYRAPHQRQQTAPIPISHSNYNQSSNYNNSYPNHSYQGSSYGHQYRHNEYKSNLNTDIKPSNYFSQINESSYGNPSGYRSSSGYNPQYGFQYRSESKSDYKPYQSLYTTNFDSNNYISHGNYDRYAPYRETSSYRTEQPAYKKYQPTFKPVDLTPIPTFDNYKSTYAHPKTEYSKISAYNQSSYCRPSIESTSFSSTTSFQAKEYNSYQPSYNCISYGDFSQDFTPPDILSKLRSENRQNIGRIRQSMKDIQRKSELPTQFGTRKQISNMNSSSSLMSRGEPNQSQSRVQYEQQHHHKNYISKPYTANMEASSSYRGYATDSEASHHGYGTYMV